jgi:undecaprenyl-diphosphatase
VIVWTADAFVDMAAALKARDPTVQWIDAAVNQWFGSRRTPPASAFFVTVTTAAGPEWMGGLVAAVVLVLLVRRRFRWAAHPVITSVSGVLLDLLLKLHFSRRRPDLKAALLDATGYSFPSGHAMSGAVILGTFAYLASRSAWSWGRKSAALAAFGTVALATGVSRLYLGVRWTSDVGARMVAGLPWVHSAEDFIRLAGTESSMSGKAYSVACPGKPEIPSKDWLQEELRRIREGTPGP